MILTYHDGFCVRASAGDTTVVFGPVSKASKTFKPTNFGADVAFISLNNDPDMNGLDEAGRGERQPFAILGPGEYEVKGMTAAGFPSRSLYAGKERINTVYSLHFDGLSVLYLGAQAGDIPKEVLEMDAPDVLIVPIGGEGVLSPSEAQKIAVKLEAKFVIPICYDAKTLTTFLKEAGSEGVKPVDKLTIKKKDAADKQNEVVVLSS